MAPPNSVSPPLHRRQALSTQQKNELCTKANYTWLVCSSTGFIGCCRITGQSELCTACGRDPKSAVSDQELLELDGRSGASSPAAAPGTTNGAAKPAVASTPTTAAPTKPLSPDAQATGLSTAIIVTRDGNAVPTTITSVVRITDTPSATPSSSSSGSSSISPGAAAGAAVGGVLGLILIIGLFFLFRRRRRRRAEAMGHDIPPPGYPSPSLNSPKEKGVGGFFEPWKNRFSKQSDGEETNGLRGGTGVVEIDGRDVPAVAEMDGLGLVEIDPDGGRVAELEGDGRSWDERSPVGVEGDRR